MTRKKIFRFKEKSLPALRSVVLRGKHARLGKADIVQRDAARRAEQADTLSAHRSIDKADHYARDNVGIMKPPDVTWWPWLLLTGLLVGIIIIIWLKEIGKYFFHELKFLRFMLMVKASP